MRNRRGSTCVAPWSVRVRLGVKVSMPVELDNQPAFSEQGYSMREPITLPNEWKKPKEQPINA